MKKIKEEIKREFQTLHMDDTKDQLKEELLYTHQEKRQKQKKRPGKMIYALAMVILISFVTLNINTDKETCIVSFDVNPHIELEIDDTNHVVDYSYHNEEGKAVLEDMDLQDTDVDVAVNAIIGSMFRHGYIDEIKNSVLITVLGEDDQTRKDLKNQVVNDVKEILNGFSIEASVVSQDIKDYKESEELSKQYNISIGKAALIQEVIHENPDFEFASLAGLSISDLNTLVHYQNITFKTITIDGVESREGYLTEDEVKDIVLEHAKVLESDLVSYDIDLGCEDERLLFIIEFQDDYATYYYKVNAISGEIVSFDMEMKI